MIHCDIAEEFFRQERKKIEYIRLQQLLLPPPPKKISHDSRFGSIITMFSKDCVLILLVYNYRLNKYIMVIEDVGNLVSASLFMSISGQCRITEVLRARAPPDRGSEITQPSILLSLELKLYFETAKARIHMKSGGPGPL